MKLPLVVVALVAFSAVSSGAQQPEEGWSPSGELKFEVRGEKDAKKEIWILPGGKGEGAKKMATSMGWGNLRVHIAPGDKTIVIQDGGGSLGINVRVFRFHAKDDAFLEDGGRDIGAALEKWALKKVGAPEGLFLGHRYVRLHGWSADGTKALVSISGHDGKVRIPGWFAIYDIGSGGLSFDLADLNG